MINQSVHVFFSFFCETQFFSPGPIAARRSWPMHVLARAVRDEHAGTDKQLTTTDSYNENVMKNPDFIFISLSAICRTRIKQRLDARVVVYI